MYHGKIWGSLLPWKEHMTLIAVLRSPDGAVIAADSQETVMTKRERWKYSVQKIKPEAAGRFDIAVAGGGDGELMDAFVDQFENRLAHFSGSTLKEFKQFMQSEILRFTREEKTWTAGRKMRLIVAASSHEQREFELWRSAGSKLIRIDAFHLVGFSDYLYQHAASQMYSPTMPLGQTVLLSLRILDLAKSTSGYVDRPYSVVTVRGNAIQMQHPEIIHTLVESVTLLDAAFNSLFIACADPALPLADFNKQLQEFSETTRQMRRTYQQSLSALSLWRTLNDPEYRRDISDLGPPGAIATVTENGTVIAREQTEEEKDKYRKLLEAAADGANQMASEKFARLIEGRQAPIYIGQECITVKASPPKEENL
jgi:hypothetical protein